MEKFNVVYLYAKTTDNVRELQFVLQSINLRNRYNEIRISTEPRRSFIELEEIKKAMKDNDICVITNPAVLGLNEADVATQLDWFIKKSRILLVYDFSSTYNLGIGQPLNQAVLQAIQQSVLEQGGKRIIKIPENRKSNSGRTRIEFPPEWENLYAKWEKKEISSKEFYEMSGLKRATFYNLLTEYREIIEQNNLFFDRYRKA